MASLEELLENRAQLDPEKIEQLIEAVNTRLEESKSILHSIVDEKREQFVSSLHCSEQIFSSLSRIDDAIKQIEQVANGDGKATSQLVLSLEQLKQINTRIANANAVIGVLTSLSRIHKELQVFDDNFQRGDLSEVGKSIMQAQHILEQLPPSNNSHLIRLVRRRVSKKRARLASLLQQLLDEAIQWTPLNLCVQTNTTISPRKSLHQNSFKLFDIWEAVEGAGVHDSVIQKIANQLLSCLISPIFEAEEATIYVKEEENNFSSNHKLLLSCHIKRSSKHTSVHTQSPTSVSNSKELHQSRSMRELQTILQELRQIFTFISLHVFNSNGGLMNLLGHFIWGGENGLEFRLKVLIEESVPNNPTQMSEFEEVVKNVQEFCTWIVSLELIEESKTNNLLSFLEDLDRVFLNKRRTQLLVQARELIITDDHNSIRINDATEQCTISLESTSFIAQTTKSDSIALENSNNVDSTFDAASYYRIPDCHVSQNTKQIIELVYEILEEATKSSPRACEELYHIARDVLDLYRAVYPTAHADKLECSSRVCMLFHNNCMYIAHHVMTIGRQFRRMPSTAIRHATMVDMTPAFRRLGENYFLEQMRRQRDELKNFLIHVDGFQYVGDENRFEQVESSFKKILHHFEQISSSWGDILPSGLYFASCVKLLDCVLDQIIKFVLELRVIQDLQKRQLHYLLFMIHQVDGQLMKPLCKRSMPKISTSILTEVTNHPQERDTDEPLILSKCSHWATYCAVEQLLEEDIQGAIRMWNIGRLDSINASLVSSLVCALFDSDSRRSALLEAISTKTPVNIMATLSQ